MYLLGKWRHATFPLVQAKLYSNIKAKNFKIQRFLNTFTANEINPIVFYYYAIDPFFFSSYSQLKRSQK